MNTTSKEKEYDERHGGPFDRGGADAYYHRPRNPHYYVGKTRQSDLIREELMTAEEITAYHAGYDWGKENE